ncbi:unnamed protein product [Rotaria sordida]|uniref:Uncharacterized protein n=1 Tax=Rotaria sordida TaxID=392033 RepID=A0A819I6N5_9BILA|nr:unnamed protein product [Rotaria sordida]CAF1231082.1 unnamed protein product [Rotaria sordida]CAF1316298.1 unnamed protein product [Rotaria sordida]CAF1583119.1 unnamed protein product [Rotaria sordida]CAF3785420.1 unnamed protein product [Rotaria sordida]
MNDTNNISDIEQQTPEIIFVSLLNDMIDQVLLMRKHHLVRLNRERVRRYHEQRRQADKSGYILQIREQKQRYRASRRSNQLYHE